MQIKFQEFDKSKTCLDDFKLFKNLVKVVKSVLTLSHGQVSIDREFSVNKFMFETNMKEELIVARKLIRDHMLAHSLSPESFVIIKPLITSCPNAHKKYKEHLESVKNAKEQEKVSKEMKSLWKRLITLKLIVKSWSK